MNIDKQIEKIIYKNTENWDKNGWGELKDTMIPKLVSQIKQSILKAIDEVRPSNQDDGHYNEALDDYDNRIFNLLSEAKKK